MLSLPPAGSSAGFRDPARPWRAADGYWYIVVGGGIQGKEAQGLLYRAENASLTKFHYVTAVLTRNRTVGFGKNDGFFDMMECPDFFPIGPRAADGSQKHVFISSAYLGNKSPLYPADGFHNAVTWWIGNWAPGGLLDVEASGIVDWGAAGRNLPSLATNNLLENPGGGESLSRGDTLLPSVYADARYIDDVIVSKVTYYSAKSISDGRPGNDAETRLLGGWVMDSNGMSEPRYVGRKSPLATKNLLEVALCFLLTCSSSDDVIAF